LNGFLCGIFGTDKVQKTLFEGSIAKKSETEGIIVYHRNENGLRFSFLDDVQFPDKIQGYSRIASLSDYSYYLFPSSGKLTAADGELAVLLDAYGTDGIIEVIDSNVGEETIRATFKGLNLTSFPIEKRDNKSSIIDLSKLQKPKTLPREGTIIYIDRAFTVKGVGVVALGFILSGKVSVHDKLRLIPSIGESKYAEVKSIQVSDEDYDSVERGIRVGLSLKGIEIRDLSKTSWLDDGSFPLSKEVTMKFRQTPFYKQSVLDREMHVQFPGEAVLGRIMKGKKQDEIVASIPIEAPIWEGMRLCIIDLNAKNLRITGSGYISS
jgi:selenocysteine-specific translation elongation factor